MLKKELGQAGQVEPVSQNKKRASFYEGVSRHKLKGNKVWQAEFTYGEETKPLGYYATESDAACAHDAGLHEHVIGIDPMALKNLKFNFYNFRHISNPDEANVQIKKPEQYKHIPKNAREAMNKSASSSPKKDAMPSSSSSAAATPDNTTVEASTTTRKKT